MRFAIFFFILNFCFVAAEGQVDFDQTHLPLIRVYTEGMEIVDEPKVLVRCEIVNNPSGVNKIDDFPNVYNGFIGIEIRGQSSSFFEKKSYGIEFREEDGKDKDVEILGFPAEEDFVLHGPYSDKSLIRNALVYTIAGEIMEYAPRCRFVEVLIDENYQGLYLLTERIKRDVNRLDIEQLEPEDTSEEAVDAGYIIKFDKSSTEQETLWYSPYSVESLSTKPPFISSYPKAVNIQPEQIAFIREYITDFEHALAADDFQYEGKNYKDFIDIDSAIDYMLISEFLRNLDAYRVSTFMYKDRGQKLKIGPMWDFNLAMGNADFCEGGEVEGWQYDFNELCVWDSWLVHFWWKRFLEDDEFLQRYERRYVELRNNQFNVYNLYSRIDSLVEVIGDAADRNFQEYPILGQYAWPNLFVGKTHREEIDYLKNWLQDRADFMDENLIDASPAADETADPFLYPNPNQGRFSIAMGKYASQCRMVYFYDTQGELVAEVESNGERELRFTLDLPQQMYFVRLVDTENRTLGSVLRLVVY